MVYEIVSVHVLWGNGCAGALEFGMSPDNNTVPHSGPLFSTLERPVVGSKLLKSAINVALAHLRHLKMV